MSRWFRCFDDLVDDPKVQQLPAEQFKGLINLWCLASKNDGALPPVADIAFKLRIKAEKVGKLLGALRLAGLLEDEDGVTRPHNWNARQYKSDVTDPTAPLRQKAYRNRLKNRNATVTDTPPRTDTEQITDQKQNSEANASGADAPIDHRKRLFDEGLPKLARMTGKGPDACRSFVGKCLKAAGDDAVTVLGLIEDAERNRAVDPSGWIAARLKTTEIGNGKAKYGIMEAADSLRRKVASFDGPASENLNLRDGARPVVAGLLSNR
jgi:hypothetical protein